MKHRYSRIMIVFICTFLIMGCTASDPPPPTEAPPSEPEATAIPPTDEPEPTDTPEPTLVPEPTKTELPPGVLFREDFNGSLAPSWQWENEKPERWELTEDGWLQIIGEELSLLGEGTQSNLLWHDLPSGDFEITAHVKTNPFENFQQTTIYIYEDGENYIALNRGYCDICATGGGGFYMEYKILGDSGAYNVKTDAEDVYLRLESSNDMISGYYALEPGNWTRIGRFGNYFEFSRVGIGVSNVGAPEDVVGRFDYFEIAEP